MKAYLLVFDSGQETRKQIVKAVDRIQQIQNWSAFFENAVCLASDMDAKSLSRLIRAEFPSLRFLITVVEPDDKAGWLPKSLWAFLNHPGPVNNDADA